MGLEMGEFGPQAWVGGRRAGGRSVCGLGWVVLGEPVGGSSSARMSKLGELVSDFFRDLAITIDC